MNRDLGISLIYVTHDLTTAYQVADFIVVLHGGHVMEVGTPDDIVHRPAHPYTRALIEAVPSTDPDEPWDFDEQVPSPERFLPRSGELALYRTEPLRAVAAPLRPGEETTTAATIQLAISEAKAARVVHPETGQ